MHLDLAIYVDNLSREQVSKIYEECPYDYSTLARVMEDIGRAFANNALDIPGIGDLAIINDSHLFELDEMAYVKWHDAGWPDPPPPGFWSTKACLAPDRVAVAAANLAGLCAARDSRVEIFVQTMIGDMLREDFVDDDGKPKSDEEIRGKAIQDWHDLAAFCRLIAAKGGHRITAVIQH